MNKPQQDAAKAEAIAKAAAANQGDSITREEAQALLAKMDRMQVEVEALRATATDAQAKDVQIRELTKQVERLGEVRLSYKDTRKKVDAMIERNRQPAPTGKYQWLFKFPIEDKFTKDKDGKTVPVFKEWTPRWPSNSKNKIVALSEFALATGISIAPDQVLAFPIDFEAEGTEADIEVSEALEEKLGTPV